MKNKCTLRVNKEGLQKMHECTIVKGSNEAPKCMTCTLGKNGQKMHACTLLMHDGRPTAFTPYSVNIRKNSENKMTSENCTVGDEDSHATTTYILSLITILTCPPKKEVMT